MLFVAAFQFLSTLFEMLFHMAGTQTSLDGKVTVRNPRHSANARNRNLSSIAVNKVTAITIFLRILTEFKEMKPI